jgi:hypothetical protein
VSYADDVRFARDRLAIQDLYARHAMALRALDLARQRVHGRGVIGASAFGVPAMCYGHRSLPGE